MTNRGRSQGHMHSRGNDGADAFGHYGRPVVDKTGLTAKYDFVLEWTPDMGPDARAQGFGDGITRLLRLLAVRRFLPLCKSSLDYGWIRKKVQSRML
jgi:hypothetical protein